MRRTLSTNINQAAAINGITPNQIINPVFQTSFKPKQNGERERPKLSPQSTVQEEISLMSLKDLRNLDENVNQIGESPVIVSAGKRIWSGLLRSMLIFRTSGSERPTRL